MTPAQLKERYDLLGLELEEFAKAVDRKHKQQVHAWLNGVAPIPADVPAKVNNLVAAHIKKMQSLIK